MHWRQGILLAEIGILAIVGFIPNAYNMIATVMVSFACAMQVQTFRKVGGYSYASTMCIGNLRSGTAALSLYLRDKKLNICGRLLLFWNYLFLCHWCGHWWYFICLLWDSCYLDILHIAVYQFPADVFGKIKIVIVKRSG